MLEGRNNARLSVKVSSRGSHSPVSRDFKQSLTLTGVAEIDGPSFHRDGMNTLPPLTGSTTHGDLSRLGVLQLGLASASMVPPRSDLCPRSANFGKEQAGGAHLRCSQTTCHLFDASQERNATSAPLRASRRVAATKSAVLLVIRNLALGYRFLRARALPPKI